MTVRLHHLQTVVRFLSELGPLAWSRWGALRPAPGCRTHPTSGGAGGGSCSDAQARVQDAPSMGTQGGPCGGESGQAMDATPPRLSPKPGVPPVCERAPVPTSGRRVCQRAANGCVTSLGRRGRARCEPVGLSCPCPVAPQGRGAHGAGPGLQPRQQRLPAEAALHSAYALPAAAGDQPGAQDSAGGSGGRRPGGSRTGSRAPGAKRGPSRSP